MLHFSKSVLMKKQTQLLNALRVRTFSANFHFWMNSSFKMIQVLQRLKAEFSCAVNFFPGQNVRPLNKREYILDVATEAEHVDSNYSLWFRRVIWTQPLKFDNELGVTMHYNQVHQPDSFNFPDIPFMFCAAYCTSYKDLRHLFSIWSKFSLFRLLIWTSFTFYRCPLTTWKGCSMLSHRVKPVSSSFSKCQNLQLCNIVPRTRSTCPPCNAINLNDTIYWIYQPEKFDTEDWSNDTDLNPKFNFTITGINYILTH